MGILSDVPRHGMFQGSQFLGGGMSDQRRHASVSAQGGPCGTVEGRTFPEDEIPSKEAAHSRDRRSQPTRSAISAETVDTADLSAAVLEALWDDGEFLLSRAVRDGALPSLLTMPP